MKLVALLDEYKRKRRFTDTPEPPPKVEKKSSHRFVVQKHRATRLHYDFRLEMEGVLKSWAVPKGPSLDPADKRLAMQVEDHPVSYFDFEGVIPEGNYGAGTVMVWDVGTWQPLSPVPVDGVYVPGTDAEASAMLAKGDLKFRLEGKQLRGDFALVKMRSRRPGTKGTEWLLLKKRDDAVEEGYDAAEHDRSAISGRSMAEIAGDKDSAEWQSDRPASRGRLKAPWLAEAVARLDSRKKKQNAQAKASPPQKKARGETRKAVKDPDSARPAPVAPAPAGKTAARTKAARSAGSSFLASLGGARKAAMPTAVKPMLASLSDHPFDSAEWLFEIKWDGYRALAYIADGKTRLVSRNQNDLTGQFPELGDLASHLKTPSAVVDGEVVAVDAQGRASFSLMQQRTGFRKWGRRAAGDAAIPILYYAFDLIYAGGFDLRRVGLEERKRALAELLEPGGLVRISDHYVEKGRALYRVAAEKGLEGIVAKRRSSLYEETRSREWLKIKITRTIECVVGGYTLPEGSRQYFGSIVLGLYDDRKRLVHVGQAGTGFDHKTLKELWQVMHAREAAKSPFQGDVDGRKVHWIRPELVAEIKFSEWTHESAGGGLKLRAPVFLGLRQDKKPQECTLDQNRPAANEG